MAIKLWSTFRLKRDANYDTRYRALMKAYGEAGSNFWEEPTSFLAFDTEYTIAAVAAHLKKAIDPNVDVIVLRQIAVNDVCYVGRLEDPDTFRSHFPDAKKV